MFYNSYMQPRPAPKAAAGDSPQAGSWSLGDRKWTKAPACRESADGSQHMLRGAPAPLLLQTRCAGRNKRLWNEQASDCPWSACRSRFSFLTMISSDKSTHPNPAARSSTKLSNTIFSPSRSLWLLMASCISRTLVLRAGESCICPFLPTKTTSSSESSSD